MLLKQEVFNKVWDHFITQKKPRGIKSSGGCGLRGMGNTKCAIGVLIPDEIYFPGMETMPLRSLLPLIGFTEIDSHDFGFFNRLREEHDNSNLKTFRENLRTFARHYNLRVPEIC